MLTKAEKLKTVISSGLVGLSPTSMGEQDSPVFIDQMYKAGAVDRKMFSIYDSNYMDDSKSEGSRLLLGGYDMKYAAEGAEIHWASLVNQEYWMVAMSDFAVKPSQKEHMKTDLATDVV